jgi:hypothetical protein
MGNAPYFLAVFLVVAWAIGYFGTNAGAGIHMLLVLAIITLSLKVFQHRNVYGN